MQALDFGFVDGRCSFGYQECRDAEPCPLHNAWVELKQVFIEWGERTTLASLIPDAELENPSSLEP
jgi:DNA-binding IscR family transcriptional regulator